MYVSAFRLSESREIEGMGAGEERQTKKQASKKNSDERPSTVAL